VTFPVTTLSVTAPQAVSITGSFGGSMRFARLNVTPPATGPVVTAVTVEPTSVVGGNTSTGTVTLSAPAPPGGAEVFVTHASLALAEDLLGKIVTVPAGATSATFGVDTYRVSGPMVASIRGTFGGVTETAVLTVNPVEVPASVTGRVIDNGNTDFSTVGPWQTYQGPEVFQGDLHFRQAGTGANSATWTFTGLTPGASYRVSSTWFGHPLAATNATYTIDDGPGGAAPLVVSRNQQAAPNDFFDAAAFWENLVASYTVTGATLTVTLTDVAGGYVEADAIRIERVGRPLRILDNGNAGFVTAGPNPWLTYSGPEVFQSDLHFLPGGSGANTATWTFTSLPAGTYRVSATWFGHPLGAANAPFTVLDGAAPLDTVLVNQEQAPAGFTDAGVLWQDLGVFTVSSATLVVQLTDDADDHVMADAIRVEFVGPSSAAPGSGWADDPAAGQFTDPATLDSFYASIPPDSGLGDGDLAPAGTLGEGWLTSFREQPVSIRSHEKDSSPLERKGGKGKGV
jgi:hypothetical protein